MAIYVHQDGTLFHLTDGEKFSRVLALLPDRDTNALVELWFGAALPDEAAEYLRFAPAPGASDNTDAQKLPFVCPLPGHGDYRPALLDVLEPDGSSAPELCFEGYEIRPGKPALRGLPAVYAEDDTEADTLELYLRDDKTGLEVTLLQTVMNDAHALCCTTIVRNGGSGSLTLRRAASAVLHLSGERDLVHLQGQWSCERKPERTRIGRAVTTIESRRGASGHEHSPFAAVLAPDADEFRGETVGVSLVWSGSFLIEAVGCQYGGIRLVAGAAPASWALEPGETFTAPECVLTVSGDGLNGMSRIYHELYRTRLCRGTWRDRPRPVLCNNWEATTFRFDEEKILTIARTAADLGVELFVLDDGWFGHRDDDTSSLGDWTVNTEKLPGGIEGLSSRIHELGMMFGLWFEPEMVSPDSDLYRAHPDWCLHMPGRARTESRHQLILDLTRKDVRDYIVNAVSAVLDCGGVDYVKWDMNRNFTEAGSALLPPERQGEVPFRYMLGLYEVLERITARFPNILFESCASGGGRFDAGMLYYMPQTWTSDDTDAVERLYIQYGTSYVFPAVTMGAHVSAVPNGITGRSVSMRFRGDVAIGGNMGYELDVSALGEDDKEEIRGQIVRVKALRGLTATGRFTRLADPAQGRFAAWEFASDDCAEILVCLYQTASSGRSEVQFIPVRDIDEKALYDDEDGNRYAGAVLAHLGLPTFFGLGKDRASRVVHLRRVRTE